MNLKHSYKNIIVEVDLDKKQSYTFQNGTQIFWDRKDSNLNFREAQPTQGIVIDAENIPAGAEVLFHHNSTHDTNKIFNAKAIGGQEAASTIKYFSIAESSIYLFRIGDGEWQALDGFCIAERIWKPYGGFIIIDPSLIENRLYVKTGKYAGKVVCTLKYCDYEMVIQGSNGREERIIRTRDKTIGDRETEVIAIDHDLTEKVQKGELMIGLTASTAKPINNLCLTK